MVDLFIFQDWWNSTSFANYYRTWNVVVHDWLYYYGYRDFLWVSAATGNTLKVDRLSIHFIVQWTHPMTECVLVVLFTRVL